jgi:hypothetical protein
MPVRGLPHKQPLQKMKPTKLSIIAASAVALAATLATPRALAFEILEFDDVDTFGGTLSYGGADGVDPLVGTDIIFDQVFGVNTTPSGPLEIIGGKLNFETGPNLSEGALVYTFGAGGSFELTGTVIKPDLSVVASGVLLTGSFSSTSVVLGLGGPNGLFIGVGVDTKNPDLLAYYGITSTAFKFANSEIGFSLSGLEADGGFTASIIDADLTNIPDNGTTLALLGVSLLGIAAIRCFAFGSGRHSLEKVC